MVPLASLCLASHKGYIPEETDAFPKNEGGPSANGKKKDCADSTTFHMFLL
jgi:hypothetical protein